MAVFHCAYGLRGEESEGDFRAVEALAHSRGVPLLVRRVTSEERAARQGESVQEWARRIRLEALEQHAREGWAIALAHHLDDLAETVLMRLARGASPESLAGMTEWRPPFWRPLLGVRRADLAAYAAKRGITYRDDSSNATLDYARNVMRHRVLPELEGLFPGAAERIVACALEARRDGDRETMRDALAKLIKAKAPGARLSRRYLDAACERLAETKSLAKEGPEIPGAPELRLTWDGSCDRTNERGGAGAWTVAASRPGLKLARLAQHRRGLRALRRDVTLEPGAYASFRLPSPE